MKLLIRKYGDPALRIKGKPVAELDGSIRELAENMLETMRAANGIGLAAQQVGEALQLTVVDVSAVEDRPSTMTWNGREVNPNDHMPLVIINPQIETGTEKEIASEGCLSFPEISADVERAEWTKIEAQTLDGERVEIEATGLLARALQHEIDHLNGILFIDRMSSAAKSSLSSRLKRLQKETQRGLTTSRRPHAVQPAL
ncbi:MAG: peptide deformylase [Verrucomicrobia bacterium]|nr:MAG: peptide deformylase [Verrucomicrobiota bacterium]